MECTEPIVAIQSKPIETKVNHKSVKTDMYWSLMSETPTIRPLGL